MGKVVRCHKRLCVAADNGRARTHKSTNEIMKTDERRCGKKVAKSQGRMADFVHRHTGSGTHGSLSRRQPVNRVTVVIKNLKTKSRSICNSVWSSPIIAIFNLLLSAFRRNDGPPFFKFSGMVSSCACQIA